MTRQRSRRPAPPQATRPRRQDPGAEIGPWDLVDAVLSRRFAGSPADRLVLLALLKAGDGSTGANARVSLTTISLRTGLARETVVASIRRLEGLHLIARELTPCKTTVYAVHVTALFDQVANPTSQPNGLVNELDQGGPKDDLGVVQMVTHTSPNGLHIRASSVPNPVPSAVPGAVTSDSGNGDDPELTALLALVTGRDPKLDDEARNMARSVRAGFMSLKGATNHLQDTARKLGVSLPGEATP